MNAIDLVYYSGLNQLLYKKKDNDFILYTYENNKYLIIQINLSLNENNHIIKNNDNFIQILDNLLKLYNNNGNNYYKNITFNTIKYGNTILNNCIFLYNSKSEKEGFFRTKGQIEVFYIKKNNESDKNREIVNKIIELVNNKNISVRNLIKIGIQQIRARELYDFFKEKEVFIISDYNNNNKKYNIENFKKILIIDIINILEAGV